MLKQCVVLVTITICLFMLTLSSAKGQGGLVPSGPPQVTMKTLDQVEPRTPIDSLPYTISESGSYYLTNSMSSSGDGIRIESDDVTVDLMGFTISGDLDGSDEGVFIDGSSSSLLRCIVVKNGTIRSFGYGIRVEYTEQCRVDGLMVYSNNNDGMYVYGCNDVIIENCQSESNDGDGIGIRSTSGICSGNQIRRCTANNNGDDGISLSIDTDGQMLGNHIVDCSVNNNADMGIHLSGLYGECNANRIEHCTVLRNGDDGIYIYGASSGSHASANVIRECLIEGNAGHGIYLVGQGADCSGNRIVQNTVYGNGDNGIYLYYVNASRVDGNHVVGQNGTYGIRTIGEKNVIIRNSCADNTQNVSTVAGNLYGPYIQDTGNLGTVANGSNPWANFDFDD